ncbi:unnamed protein product, partial [Prorocentrum cordatum]
MRKMRSESQCNTGARPWEDELVGQKADTTDAVLYRSRSMKRPTWLLCPHAPSRGGRRPQEVAGEGRVRMKHVTRRGAAVWSSLEGPRQLRHAHLRLQAERRATRQANAVLNRERIRHRAAMHSALTLRR